MKFPISRGASKAQQVFNSLGVVKEDFEHRYNRF